MNFLVVQEQTTKNDKKQQKVNSAGSKFEKNYKIFKNVKFNRRCCCWMNEQKMLIFLIDILSSKEGFLKV
jgi:hypothetical protein